MIKLIDLLKELTGAWQNIDGNNIKKDTILTLYHATENSTLQIENKPIHLGTRDQADDRIDMLWDHSPQYYLFQVKVKLTNPCPKILWDVDTGTGHTSKDFTKYGNYNEYVYFNTAEGFPDMKDENFSLFIVDFKKSYISSKLVDVVNTGH